jgi:hypothetical protein
MSKPILAVGIDPAKRVHRAVGVLFPDEVVFDCELPNALDAIQSLDLRLAELSIEGFSRFVTSTTAPIATGWSESCRVGLSPPG